jgi:hypothetical protein
MILDHGVQREHCPLLEDDSDALMRATFAWAREVRPTQPLTTGAWRVGYGDAPGYGHRTDRAALELSDVVSFHAYCTLERLQTVVGEVAGYGRPMFCTEWMARGVGSRIQDSCRFLTRGSIGAFQWGLRAGTDADASALAGRRGSR